MVTKIIKALIDSFYPTRDSWKITFSVGPTLLEKKKKRGMKIRLKNVLID